MITLNEKLINICAEVSGKSVDLKTTIDSLDLDSLDTLELSMKMKNELNIELSADEFMLMNTIQDILTHINQKS